MDFTEGQRLGHEPSRAPAPLHFAPTSVYYGVPGYYGALKPAQERVLEQFEQLIAERGLPVDAAKHPDEHKTTFLLRFLRARKFSLANAYKMLKNDVDWRLEVGIAELRKQTPEQILGCPREVIDQHLPIFQRGFDQEGRPAFYQQATGFYIDRLLQHTTMARVLRYHMWKAEKMADLCVSQSALLGQQIETTFVVIDIRDMVMSQVTRQFLAYMKQMAKIDQDHYPERMGVLFIINIPWTFSVVWSGIKPWLDSRTKMKIKIYRDGYHAEMHGLIGVAQLPPCYGGTGAELRLSETGEGAGAAGGARAQAEGGVARRCASGSSSGSSEDDEVSGDDDDFYDAPEDPRQQQQQHHHHRGPIRAGVGALHPRQLAPKHSASADGSPSSGIGKVFWVVNRCWQCTKSWDVLACERALCRVNAFFLVLGVLLIAAGSVAHAKGVWSAELVEWAFWSTAGMIVLGAFVSLLSALGFWGARNRSDAMLSAYMWALGFVALLQAVFSALCFAAADRAQSVIGSSWSKLVDSQLVAADKDQQSLTSLMQDHQVLIGGACLATSLLSAAPLFFAARLRKAIRLDTRVPTVVSMPARERQLRQLVLCLDLLCGVVGIVCVGYGAHVFENGSWSLIFTPFILLVLGLVLLGTSVFGYCAVQHGSGSPVLLTLFAVAGGVNASVWYITAGWTLSLVPQAEQLLRDCGARCNRAVGMVPTVQEIGEARQQLYVMGLLELAIGLIMTLLTVCSVWLRRRVELMLHELEVGNVDAGAISSRKKMLQSGEKATIAWALTCGILCVFWQGEYAVFNSWMTKSDPDDHWFLHGWSIYARADKRYLLSDAFIVSMEGLSALVLGPLLLWFAWCVLQRRPERDVCGILVSSLQLYTYTMYFATAMKDSQHIAPASDALYFWFIFVFLNTMRMVMSLFILSTAMQNACRANELVALLESDSERSRAFILHFPEKSRHRHRRASLRRRIVATVAALTPKKRLRQQHRPPAQEESGPDTVAPAQAPAGQVVVDVGVGTV